ncbi:hypothetical protein Pelo_19329 [Pelomyxa schiedti]|nr:hypothetical protein Pelo_19329 [Pelomyxa schiedti]
MRSSGYVLRDVLSAVGSKWQPSTSPTGTPAPNTDAASATIRLLKQVALDALDKDCPDAAHVALRACCALSRKSGDREGAVMAEKLLEKINTDTVEKYTKHLFAVVANSTTPHLQFTESFVMPSQGMVLGASAARSTSPWCLGGNQR